MEPNERIGGRFEVERAVGAGGMGIVYRARDITTGATVAVKTLIERGAAAERERFEREVSLLASIRHDALVQFIDAGTHDGKPYLAMSWLDGEDLSKRLDREALTLHETIALLKRLASAVGALHANGVIHRDIKPGNIMLVDGQPAKAVLLDLGIARAVEIGSSQLTGTNAAIGTVGYMSPEQARGDRILDPRTDVFAIGCVAFECISGRPAFEGSHPVAVLAKLLLEEAPNLAELVPDLPEGIADVVAKMTAKESPERYEDGRAVLAALEQIDADKPAARSRRVAKVAMLSGAERRVVAVALLDLMPAADEAAATIAATDVSDARVRSAGEVAARFGGLVAPLAGGRLLVWQDLSGTATDRAIGAARLTLALTEALPEARVALAVGGAESAGNSHPMGPVIERAAGLLRNARSGEVVIDEGTAALVEARFEVDSRSGAFAITGERAQTDSGRTLLGRATPIVGREREMGTITATLDACLSEETAGAVLVTAPPGIGKSRLRSEIARRLADRLPVLNARGDMSAGAATFALARTLIRQSIPDATNVDAIAKALGSLGVGDAHATAPYIAALLGVEAQLPPGVREDVKVLAEGMRRAFLRWLDALTQKGPLAIVIDDAQWVDATSVSWLLDGYSNLAERPFFLAIFARPEVLDALPALQRAPALVRVPLPPLPRKAAERLVKHVLGDAATPELTARLVSRADGNAFYLEELLRLAARGATDDFPATVLAMAQTRLEGLSPEERKVLRAASIYGERFWTEAVGTLVGMDLQGTLDALVEHEVIERSPTTRFAGHAEFAFRHALLRDAAFASLTDGDRKRGHGLAGTWLTDQGERDPLVLAMHWEAAGERDLARTKVLAALELVYATGDTRAMHSLVERAKRLGAAGAELGSVQAIECVAWALMLNYESAVQAAEQSIGLVETGSESWFLAASVIFTGAYFGVVSPVFPDTLTQLIVMPESAVPLTGISGSAFTFALAGLAEMGMTDARDALLARFEALRASAVPGGPFDAWGNAAGFVHSYLGRVGVAGLKGREGFRQFEILGDRLGLAVVGSYDGMVLMTLGALKDARTYAETTFRNGETQGPLAQFARMSLVYLDLFDGNVDGARRWLAEMDREEIITIRVWASVCRAELALHEGRLDDVESALAEVMPIPSQIVPILTTGIRAEMLLRMGKREEAAQTARELRTTIPPGIFGWHGIRLWKTELEAEGPDSPTYTEIAKGARAIVLDVAEQVSSDAELRAAWLGLPMVRAVLERTGGLA